MGNAYVLLLLFASVHRQLSASDVAPCSTVEECREVLKKASRERIAAQEKTIALHNRAEADNKSANEIYSTIKEFPEKIRGLKERTAVLQGSVAPLKEELARLKLGFKGDLAQKMDQLQRAVSSATTESAAAKRNYTEADGRAAAARTAVEQAKAAMLAAEKRLSEDEQPFWYRSVYLWAESMHEPSGQAWIALASLLLASIGLVAPAEYEVQMCWILCILGIPCLMAVFTWSYLDELLAHTQHWGILVTIVPCGVFILFALSLYHGCRGVCFFLGAWIGRSLGCMLPYMYSSAWEVALVRFVFVLFGLGITHNSFLLGPGMPRDVVLESRKFRHPCVFAFTALCGLLFSSSVVFFITRVLWDTTAYSLCWLDFVTGLLGDRKTQDELSGLWALGAIVWMVTVAARLYYYINEESGLEDEPKLRPGRIAPQVDAERQLEVEQQRQKLIAQRSDALKSADAECSRLLLSEPGTEDAADWHEVVALITCASETLKELNNALPSP